MNRKTEKVTANLEQVDQIVSQMQNLTITSGWDVVNVLSVPQVNILLGQQYVANLSEGTALEPINATVPVIADISVQFIDLRMGSPLISFSPELEPQQAYMTINFLSGVINMIQTSGTTETVLSSSIVVPGDGFQLSGLVPLASLRGEVENGSQVVIDILNGTSFSAELGLPDAAGAILGSYFLDLLQHVATGFNYPLGTLLYASNTTDLVPVSFDFATQVDASDPSDTGRLLLFIATNYNPTGGNGTELPIPNILPAGYSNALIVSSRAVFSGIIVPSVQTTLAQSGAVFVATQPSLVAAYSASATSGNINLGVIESGDLYSSDDLDDAKPQASSVTLPLNGFSISPASDASGLLVSWSYNWAQGWCSAVPDPQYGITQYTPGSVDMSLSFNMVGGGSVDATTDNVTFSGAGNLDVTFVPSTLIEKIFTNAGLGTDFMGNLMETSLTAELQGLSSIPLPEINAFAVTNLLFPENHVIKLEDVYVPGDLIIFGKLQTSSVEITSPLMVTLACGQTQQFTASCPGGGVAWGVMGGSGNGSINSFGLYTAPASFTATPGQPVVVTAFSLSDSTQTASGVVTLVPAGVLVSPAYSLATPTALPSQFTAIVDGATPQTPLWSVDGPGSISSSGLYTPPSSISMPTVLTVTATAGNLSGSAQVMLFPASPSVVAVTPSFAQPALGPSERQQFFASLGSNTPFSWSLVPEVGSIDSTGRYTAPDNIETPQFVAVVATSTLDESQFGVGLLSLTPPTNE